VTLYWYERRRPPEKLLQGQKPTAAGHIMIGSRGTIHMTNDNASNLTLLPANQFQGFQDPPRTLTRSPGHQREWLDAARGGRPALSNFVDYASLLTETVLLGNLAIRVGGKRIVWDAEKMRVVDTPAADRFIRRDYRKRWSLSNI
jgi:hypothetical protein